MIEPPLAIASSAGAAAMASPVPVPDDEYAFMKMVGHAGVRERFLDPNVWGVIGLWRLRGINRAFRRWSTEKLASLARVVAVGGLVADDEGDEEISTPGVEVLDLSTMKWEVSAGVPPLPHVREWYSTCSSFDGRIVVSGGYDEAPDRAEPLRRRSVVEWLPGTVNWSQLPDLPEGRTSAATVSLPDGRTLCIGGGDSTLEKNCWALASTVVLSADRSNWTAISPMAEPRDGAAAVLLDDGKVIVAGGQNGDGQASALKSAEIWDPMFENWSPLPPMNVKRSSASACVLPSGRVAVVGGEGDLAATGEVYDPTRGVWEPLPDMPHPCGDPLAPVPGGLIVVSCQVEPTPVALSQLYDEASNKWFELPHAMVHPRYNTRVVSVPGKLTSKQPSTLLVNVSHPGA